MSSVPGPVILFFQANDFVKGASVNTSPYYLSFSDPFFSLSSVPCMTCTACVSFSLQTRPVLTVRLLLGSRELSASETRAHVHYISHMVAEQGP